MAAPTWTRETYFWKYEEDLIKTSLPKYFPVPYILRLQYN